MRIRHAQHHALLAVSLLSLFMNPSFSQEPPPVTLKEAAQLAVLKNPEVQTFWHSFRDAAEEIGVARGGFLPKVDASAGPGRDRLTQGAARTTQSFQDNQTSLTLRQMLFDGFATVNEVKRLGKAKMVRYFELLDAMENTALEAGKAYLDVMRYRQHLILAEENHQQHKVTHGQLLSRARSGVGKPVDVDQAESRLALADVNVTTASANLHDVTARYLRIVGELPGARLAMHEGLEKSLPASVEAALSDALGNNPALRASIENVEAAQHDIDWRRAAYMPRAEFVMRNDRNSNYLDSGLRNDTRVEFRINFNLFNGGSDMARVRQYRERKEVALDKREKVCRDMRQTVSVAYNDIKRLNDQLTRIRTQVALLEKTRSAYRDQFNIGQRTLLDLLNTQNEYFDARRALANANIDLAIAHLRSYAGMGRLLDNLGLRRLDAGSAELEESAADRSQLCPAISTTATAFPRDGI